MKTLLIAVLSSTILGACISTAEAQTKTNLESTIKGLEQAVVIAILQNDTNALKQLWAPEFMVNNPRNNISPDRAAVLKLQREGMINYSIFDKVVEQVLVSKNTVVAMGHESIVSKNDIPGVKAGVMFKRRFTNVWMKKKGHWQQVARHASVICN